MLVILTIMEVVGSHSIVRVYPRKLSRISLEKLRYEQAVRRERVRGQRRQRLRRNLQVQDRLRSTETISGAGLPEVVRCISALEAIVPPRWP
jgi:hypothetical protein